MPWHVDDRQAKSQRGERERERQTDRQTDRQEQIALCSRARERKPRTNGAGGFLHPPSHLAGGLVLLLLLLAYGVRIFILSYFPFGRGEEVEREKKKGPRQSLGRR